MLLWCFWGVQMRLQLSDVCGEGRVVAGASRYEFMLTMFCSQMYRCVDDVDNHIFCLPPCTSEARLVSARSDDDRSLANQQHRLVAFPGLLPLLRVFHRVSKLACGYVFHDGDGGLNHLNQKHT